MSTVMVQELLRPASDDHQQQQQQQVDHRGNFPMAFMMDLAKALSRIDPRGTNGVPSLMRRHLCVAVHEAAA